MPPAPLLLLLLLPVLAGMARAQQAAGFYPSLVFMSSPSVSSFVLGNTTEISLHLVLGPDVVTPTVSSCGGPNATSTWYLTLDASQSFSKVTLHLNRTLLPCSSKETECCFNSLKIIETLQVVACQDATVFGVMHIEAKIHANSTFRGNVSENITVIPNQVYHPLGPCPCDLTTGACDTRCCCDQECTSEMRQLFSELCYTGVFGGNVTPPFDQLCMVQAVNNAPDWFPFLCVQSPLDNTPFLGLFYQGATISGSQVFSFKVSLQNDLQPPTGHYKQGDPIIFIDHNDHSQYFTIPQSVNGQCIRNSPVAFLQNFDTVCTNTLTSCSDVITPSLPQSKSFSINIVWTSAEAETSQPICMNVTLEANYTFIWEGNLIKSVNVSVIKRNISVRSNGILTQRFRAEFVNVNRRGPSAALSGNPGYQIGRPVLVGNESASVIIGTQLNLWKPDADGLCTSANRKAVLFGEDATSGCFVRIQFDENCTQIRKTVSEILRSLVPATHVAKRGNSNASDLNEWVGIIYGEQNSSTSDCSYGILQDIPANLNIRVITTVVGAVEGILQQEILAVSISFSTAVWQFQCSSACENYSQSFLISASVQFIKIPAQPPPSMTSFQLNYTEYDCNRNEVCWPHLAYPVTQYYTGETYSQCITKGLVLVSFFLLAALLSRPWNLVHKAWNNTTF